MIGKSKKPRKMKKKQLEATNISSENLLEKRGDVEDEVYEMSSGDEDYSKGMKSMILVLLVSHIHFIFAYVSTLLFSENS